MLIISRACAAIAALLILTSAGAYAAPVERKVLSTTDYTIVQAVPTDAEGSTEQSGDAMFPVLMVGAGLCLVTLIVGLANKHYKLIALGAGGCGLVIAIQWSVIAGVCLIGGGGLALLMQPMELDEEGRSRKRDDSLAAARSEVRKDKKKRESAEDEAPPIPEFKEQAFSGKLNRPL